MATVTVSDWLIMLSASVMIDYCDSFGCSIEVLHGSHVAWQEQKIPFPMGKEVLSYAKYSHLFLPCNMAAVQNLYKTLS